MILVFIMPTEYVIIYLQPLNNPLVIGDWRSQMKLIATESYMIHPLFTNNINIILLQWTYFAVFIIALENASNHILS